jgi:ribosomal protein L32E
MDGRFRRHFKGTPSHVKIGYGSNKNTRFLMPDGFLKVIMSRSSFSALFCSFLTNPMQFQVSNVKELEMLLMHNKKYAAGEDESCCNVLFRIQLPAIAHTVCLQKSHTTCRLASARLLSSAPSSSASRCVA